MRPSLTRKGQFSRTDFYPTRRSEVDRHCHFIDRARFEAPFRQCLNGYIVKDFAATALQDSHVIGESAHDRDVDDVDAVTAEPLNFSWQHWLWRITNRVRNCSKSRVHNKSRCNRARGKIWSQAEDRGRAKPQHAKNYLGKFHIGCTDGAR